MKGDVVILGLLVILLVVGAALGIAKALESINEAKANAAMQEVYREQARQDGELAKLKAEYEAKIRGAEQAQQAAWDQQEMFEHNLILLAAVQNDEELIEFVRERLESSPSGPELAAAIVAYSMIGMIVLLVAGQLYIHYVTRKRQ